MHRYCTYVESDSTEKNRILIFVVGICALCFYKKKTVKELMHGTYWFSIYSLHCLTDRSVVGSHDVHSKASNGNQFLITNDEFKLNISIYIVLRR